MAGKTSKSTPTPAAEPPDAASDDPRPGDEHDADDRAATPATGGWYERMAIESPLASPKLKAAAQDHNSKVEDLAALRGRTLRLRKPAGAVALTFDNLCRHRDEIHAAALQAMQMQFQLAAARVELLELYHTELVAGHPAARAELEAEEIAVRGELEGIGFEASALPVAARHPTPAAQQIAAIVQQHPRYLSAAKKLRTYDSEAITTSSALAKAREFRAECEKALSEFVGDFLAK